MKRLFSDVAQHIPLAVERMACTFVLFFSAVQSSLVVSCANVVVAIGATDGPGTLEMDS